MAQTVSIISILPYDRARLVAVAGDRNSSQKHVQRARIVLLSADRLPVLDVARQIGISRPAVWRWQVRYAEQGVDGLLRDKTRKPGKAVGISLRAVQRIWDAHRLQPHRLRTFKKSKDPAFAEKVEDVVGLYMEPPCHAVVLSIDEKSQIQALDRTQPGLPLKPGKCATMTRCYGGACSGFGNGGGTTLMRSWVQSQQGGRITAGGDIDLTALTGDVVNVTKLAELKKDGSDVRDVRIGRGEISAGGDLTVTAGTDIVSIGAGMAAGGTADLAAGRDVVLQSNELRHDERAVAGRDGYIIGNLTHDGSSLSAGQDVVIAAGRDVAVSGSTVAARGDAAIAAGRDIAITAVVDQLYSQSWSKKKNSSHEGTASSQTNLGNLGKVLQELGSEATLRNLAVTLAAAGLTQVIYRPAYEMSFSIQG